jgi:hypothetical protein
MDNPPSSTSSTNDDPEAIAADILRGAIEISRECGVSVHRIYKDFEAGRLTGAWKIGGRLHASKRAMRRAHHNRARTGR